MPDIQILVAIFALLMALDVVQTYYFPRFGLKEGNPWLAQLMSQDGFEAIVFVKYAVFVAVVVTVGQGWLPALGLWVVIALQASVVAWNAYKMIQTRAQ